MRDSDFEVVFRICWTLPQVFQPPAAVSLFRTHLLTYVPMVHSNTASMQAWSSPGAGWALVGPLGLRFTIFSLRSHVGFLP